MPLVPTVLAGLSVLLPVATVLAARRRSARAYGIATGSKWVGIAQIAVALVAVLTGFIATGSAASSPGLSADDQSRMWSNGLAEAIYNFAFGAVLGGPAWWVGRHYMGRAAPARLDGQ